MQVSFYVNGHRERADVEPRRTLADALREDLGLGRCTGYAGIVDAVRQAAITIRE